MPTPPPARTTAVALLLVALGAAWVCAACANWRLGPGEPPAITPAQPPVQPRIPEEAPPSAFIKGEKRRTAADIYVLIACASANNPSGRWSEPGWVKKGLAKIPEEVVMPRYREGYRRFYIDSPFGKETDNKGVPQFTFFGAIHVGGDSPWRRGFIDAWQRVTRLSGMKVMAYMGNPYADAEFKRLVSSDKPEDKERALKMLRDAMSPIIAAGFQGIGIDASFDTPEDSPLGEALKEWQARGLEVFIEGTPTKRQRWLTRFGTIRTVWMARNAPNFKELLEPKDCEGERIQVFEGTHPWPDADGRPFEEWGRRWVKKCLDGGEHPAITLVGIKGDPKRVMGLE